MNNPTPFDLNRAIQHWREDLGQSPAFRSENLAELELHLRDSVAGLEARGLSAEEAFLIATKRIGNQGLLEAEFGKVNRQAVWFDRLLWILLAFQTWEIISSAVLITSGVASVFTAAINELLPGFGVHQVSASLIQVSVGALAFPLALTVAVAIGWWFFIRPKERVHPFFQKLPLHPWSLALVLFATCVIFKAGASWAMYYWVLPQLYHQIPSFSYVGGDLGRRLPGFAILALLTLFVARKRLRLRPA